MSSVLFCKRPAVSIKAIGVGEKVEDLQAFDPERFVDALVPDE